MPLDPAEATPSAYAYPLLVKQLLHSARATAGDQEIIYRDRQRHSYRQFFERLPRLANALAESKRPPGGGDPPGASRTTARSVGLLAQEGRDLDLVHAVVRQRLDLGCGALCPGYHRGCYGCFGPADVAALAGVRDDALYEGQAAIELEALADDSAGGVYEFGVSEGPDGALVVDGAPVLEALLDDIVAGVDAPVSSARFHRAVVTAVVDVCARLAPALGLTHVALSGGVFMNRLVVRGAIKGLSEIGLTPLTHLRLPANDGGIAFGQATVAWARRHEV